MDQLGITRRLVLMADDGIQHVGAVELSDGTACTPMGMPERQTHEEAFADARAVVWEGDGPVYVGAMGGQPPAA